MNAARALRVARRRAGLSQSELAERVGVPRQVVNRIERARVIPKVDTLERLLAAAGHVLTIAPRRRADVNRGAIRGLLAQPPRARIELRLLETLDELCRRKVRFVLVGDAAARLRGAPIDASGLEIQARDDPINLKKLDRLIQVDPHLTVRLGRFEGLVADAEELPWLPAPRMRLGNHWLDSPTGFVASLSQLLTLSCGISPELLHAVQEETDLLQAGFRVYRDPDRRDLRLPPQPSRFLVSQGRRRSHRQDSLSQVNKVDDL